MGSPDDDLRTALAALQAARRARDQAEREYTRGTSEYGAAREAYYAAAREEIEAEERVQALRRRAVRDEGSDGMAPG